MQKFTWRWQKLSVSMQTHVKFPQFLELYLFYFRDKCLSNFAILLNLSCSLQQWKLIFVTCHISTFKTKSSMWNWCMVRWIVLAYYNCTHLLCFNDTNWCSVSATFSIPNSFSNGKVMRLEEEKRAYYHRFPKLVYTHLSEYKHLIWGQNGSIYEWALNKYCVYLASRCCAY